MGRKRERERRGRRWWSEGGDEEKERGRERELGEELKRKELRQRVVKGK